MISARVRVEGTAEGQTPQVLASLRELPVGIHWCSSWLAYLVLCTTHYLPLVVSLEVCAAQQ